MGISHFAILLFESIIYLSASIFNLSIPMLLIAYLILFDSFFLSKLNLNFMQDGKVLS